MDVLLIDYGLNSYKVGRSPDTVCKVYGLKDGVLEMNAKCHKIGSNYEVSSEGSLKLNEVLKTGNRALPTTFLVSQHMDQELKRESFCRKTFEVYFEKYGFEKGQTWLQPLLCYYASRATAGTQMLLIDSGEESTYFIPFYDDFIIRDSIERSPLSGSTLTGHFSSLLARRGYQQATDQSNLKLQFLKESSLEVCPDFDFYYRSVIEKENFYWRNLQLPDGSTTTLKKEVFEIPEVLFRPCDYGFGGQGLAEKMFSSIKVS